MDPKNEMDELINIINNVLNLDIRKKTNERDYVDGRFIFANIMVNRGYSLVDLGKHIKKHHSTIIHYKKSCNDLLDTNPTFSVKYAECRDKFMEGKEDFSHTGNEIELKNQIDKLILDNKNLTKKLDKYKRLHNIIEFIDSRTPKGKESFILRKINLMLNGLTDYGQQIE
jgi:hypothetical protein